MNLKRWICGLFNFKTNEIKIVPPKVSFNVGTLNLIPGTNYGYMNSKLMADEGCFSKAGFYYAWIGERNAVESGKTFMPVLVYCSKEHGAKIEILVRSQHLFPTTGILNVFMLNVTRGRQFPKITSG